MENNIEYLIDQVNKLGEIFKLVYDEHVKDNSQVLSYLLIADYTRAIEELIQNDGKNVYIEETLSLFDEVFKSYNKEAQDIVYISFIENLSKQSQEFVLNTKFNNLKNELKSYIELSK